MPAHYPNVAIHDGATLARFKFIFFFGVWVHRLLGRGVRLAFADFPLAWFLPFAARSRTT
jgi:hypothetical protein